MLKDNSNYNIIITYSIVNYCELIKRNKGRAYINIKNFIKDNKNKPAPRLPNLSSNIFKEDIKKIIDNLNILLNPQNKYRLDNKQYQLLLFDNNNEEMKNIYDSEKIKNVYNIEDKSCDK